MEWWLNNNHFSVRSNKVFLNDISLEEIAKNYGTPLYVYSLNRIKENYESVAFAMEKFRPKRFKLKIYYAGKANSAVPILKMLRVEGANFSACSLGEVQRAIACGYLGKDIFFTAPSFGFDNWKAIINSGVIFNAESFSQLQKLREFGPLEISIRHNPGVEGVGFSNEYKMSGTDIRSSRFGIYKDRIIEAFLKAREFGLKPIAIHQHVGSNWTKKENLGKFIRSIESCMDIVQQLENLDFHLKMINFGGGIGVKSHNDYPDFPMDEYAKSIWETVDKYDTSIDTIAIEPGRYIVDSGGILLAQINLAERKNNIEFLGLDAGFNLMHHTFIYGIKKEIVNVSNYSSKSLHEYSVGGYLGEQGDMFFENVVLPECKERDIVAMFPAGAYCASELAQHHLLPIAKELFIKSKEETVFI